MGPGQLTGVTASRRRAGRPAWHGTDREAVAQFERCHGRRTFAPIVVVIPAYNEAASIGAVLDELPRQCCGLPVDVVVIVDGATDTTAEVAAAHGARVCVTATKRGQGAALRLGYALARRGAARYVVTTDADGQYDGGELGRLVAPLVEGTADLVTGSRWLGRQERASRVRRVGSRFFAGLVSLLTGHEVTDTSFGFRAMRAPVTEGVELEQSQYQSAELLISALARSYRVVEVPMTLRARSHGHSKKGNAAIFGSAYALAVFRTWRRERRRAACAERGEFGSVLPRLATRVLRYVVGSVVAAAVSQFVLVLLVGVFGVVASASGAAAFVAGALPNWALNRRWAWARRGPLHLRREVLGYWSIVAASLLATVAATTTASAATGSLPHWARVAAVDGAFVAVTGALFLAKFLLFDRVVFRDTAPDVTSGLRSPRRGDRRPEAVSTS